MTESRSPEQIHGVLDPWLKLRPDAAALIVDAGRSITWRMLGAAVDEAAQCLTACGVRPGDRVMIVAENSLSAVAFLLACSRHDAWAVPVNARITVREIEEIWQHCTPRAVIFAAPGSRDAAFAVADEMSGPTLGTVQVKRRLAAEVEPMDQELGARTAVLMYTSGTTGRPKGVMLTHSNLLFVARTVGSLRQLSPLDLVYGLLPISHVYGLTSVFLGPLLAGSSLQLVSRFDVAHVTKSLANGVSVLLGVPRLYAALLDHVAAAEQPPQAPKLRLVSSGGAPMDLDVKRRVEHRFGMTLHNGYGLTEASPTVAQTFGEMQHLDNSIGRAIPGVDVRIVDASGAEDLSGAVGEIWVRGPNVMKGYYRDSAATQAAITSDGWLRTGDLGRQAENRSLYVVGRLKELIIHSGFNVYPAEIEAVLSSHVGVLQSAVVGAQRPGNEDIIAFVEPAPGAHLNERELMEFVSARLAPYKRPQRVIIFEHLPTTSSGKTKKHVLRNLAQELE